MAEPIVGHVLDLFRLGLDPARAGEPLPSLLTSPSAASTRASCVPSAGAALLADRSLADHVRARAVPPPLPEAPSRPLTGP